MTPRKRSDKRRTTMVTKQCENSFFVLQKKQNQEENQDITKHLENLFRHNFENLETEENNSDTEEALNEEQISSNKLTLNEEDLSTLSINL